MNIIEHAKSKESLEWNVRVAHEHVDKIRSMRDECVESLGKIHNEFKRTHGKFSFSHRDMERLKQELELVMGILAVGAEHDLKYAIGALARGGGGEQHEES